MRTEIVLLLCRKMLLSYHADRNRSAIMQTDIALQLWRQILFCYNEGKNRSVLMRTDILLLRRHIVCYFADRFFCYYPDILFIFGI